MKKWTSLLVASAFLCLSQKGSACFFVTPNIPSPSNLNRVAYDSNTQELSLSWQDNAIDETGYVVFVSHDGGATWAIASGGELSADSTSAVIYGVDEGAFPYFYVAAERAGGISYPSNIISVIGTDPAISDTDGDGMLDAFEVTSGLNPLADDSYEDLDGDRYPNIFEYHLGSDVADGLSIPIADFVVGAQGPYSTIQGALNAVDDDFQIVMVSEGTYRGAGNRNLSLQSSHPILLISETGAASTIIDAEGQGRGLTLPNSSVVDGFTFKNGSETNGGAVQVTGGSPVIINSVFLRNAASQLGGAIYLDGGDVSLVHCTILGGSAGQGGAAIAAANGNATILKSIVWVDAPFSATNLSISDSVVKGGYAGSGNLASDPLLTPSGHLTAASPAIDKGDILLTSLFDMDGEIRPEGTTTDLGADEFVDTDSDGLADWWEQKHFGNLTADGSSDPDGDGRTNLQEYANGGNPNNYFSQGETEITPALHLVSGNGQTGAGERFLPIPLKVRVTDGSGGSPLANAPVTIEVESGGGKIALGRDGTHPLEESLSLQTDVNGFVTVYFKLPSSFSASHSIQVAAGEAGTAAFTVYQELPYSATAQIALGDHHAIALAVDGSLWGWGYNGYGQVGDGTTTVRTKPVPMKPVPGFRRGKFVSAGPNYSAVIDENGNLWTWGYNGNGQLGDGTTTVRYSPTKVNFPPNTPPIVAVECGPAHMIALDEDGDLWAWGYNGYGGLGNGTTQQSLVPVAVSKPSGMGEVLAIGAGQYSSYALDDSGKVWAWGYNAAGRLGDGSGSNQYTPVQVDTSTGLPAISSISVKQNHVLAYGADGKIWAWGENGNGQLGDGTTTNRTRPVEIVSTLVPTGTIGAGYYHSLAASSSGVWAWGYNVYGQLGDDTTTGRTSPVESQAGPGMSNIVQLSGSYYHSMALTADGGLWVWGYNGNGNLGDGTTTTRRVPILLSNFKLSNDDSDSDGLPDSWEHHYFGGLSQGPLDDFDGDGLSNEDEYLLGLNPAVADSDNDGMPDGYEVQNGFNPLDEKDALEDFDGDRIPNLWEYHRGTSALDVFDRPSPDRIVDPALAGTGNYVATIQAAINAAPTSSSAPNYYNIIEVRSGVYTERLSISSRKITLLGELGTAPTVIQSDERNYQILDIYDSAVVDGFRFTRPKNSTTLVQSTASAIQVSTQNPTLLTNLIIDGNRANYGGAIQKSGTGRLSIHHTTIFGTSANYYGNAIYATNGKLDLVNSIVWAETAPASQQIYSSSTAVTASGCIIRGGELGALNSDPLLTPEGWLKKGSPAIESGVWSHVAHDIHGELRDAPPSIGADEFIDSDDDGLPDWYESMGVTDPLGDNDGDGLTNLEEYEVHGTNATVADSDGDGLNDSAEIAAGSDPLNPDSDNDGMPDGYEVANGLNPLLNDAYADLDGDRIPNLFEYKHGWKVAVAGRDPDPNNSVSNPPAVYTVDAQFTNDDPINHHYRTIQAAVNHARTSQNIGGQTVYPNRYAVIDVKSGVYVEKVNVSNVEVLLLAELGGANGPVEVRYSPNPGSIDNTVELYSPTIMDGFVITHAEGRKGRGVYLADYGTGLLRRLVNCIIRENTGASEGGAIFNSGTNLELVNCTILGNSTVSTTAIAIYNSSGTINIWNSIIWNEGGQGSNEIYPSTSSSIQVFDSIVKGGQYGASGSDPLLNRYGYLTQGSPAINTGGTGEHLAAVDIHGEQRPDGLAPDKGADEFVDTDSDGLPDWWEAKHFGSATASIGGGDDGDSDGVSNLDEYKGGLDPQNADTDGDGLNDGAEISLGSNPLQPDTDKDGMPDGWEVDNGLNPIDASDALHDNDGDRVPNLWEFTYLTDPNSNLSVPVPTRVVAPSGGDHESLSSAQYAAGDLEIIEVRSGTYEDEIYAYEGKRLLWLGELDSPDGPPIIVPSYYYSPISLYETTVMDGFAIENGEYETGALYVYKQNPDRRPHVRFVNCTIRGFGGDYSDVIYNEGAFLEFIHCTIVENKSGYGAIIYHGTQNATTHFVNSILWNPGSPTSELLASNNQYQITNSIILGEAARGAIDSDPLHDRYGNLMSESPAIGAGAPVAASRVDIHGEARPGSTPDIGADQYVDSDTDGLPDWWEIAHFDDLSEDSEGDPDSDQLTNYYEYLLGFDPNDPDTYGTGMGDYFEALTGISDPWYPEEWIDDPDGDGVPTYLELLYGFDPNNPDTAGVGISDGALLHMGLDPNETDWDGDGISNTDEVARGLNPFVADSDGDGVPDGTDAFPLDPNRSTPETGDVNDTTPPDIILIEPTGAVLVP